MIFISDLFRACAVIPGLALGDAFGAPFEGGPPPGRIVRDMEGGGPYALRPGTTTDDTLQAVAVAASLVTCRGFCPGDVLSRLVRAYRSAPRFFGPTSSRVLSLAPCLTDPFRAAAIVHRSRGGSRSNGSVMRGPPLGVIFHGPELEQVSLTCSALTHADLLPGACSAFLNRMIAGLCEGKPRQDAFLGALSRCRNQEVAGVLGSYSQYDPVGGLDALDCTHAAVRIVMEAAGFEDAVCRAVSLGGDTDTVGACTGALAGACFGIVSLPPRWLACLEGAGDLIALSFRLASIRAVR